MRGGEQVLGGGNQEVSCGCVEAETLTRHPSRDVKLEVGAHGEVRRELPMKT